MVVEVLSIRVFLMLFNVRRNGEVFFWIFLFFLRKGKFFRNRLGNLVLDYIVKFLCYVYVFIVSRVGKRVFGFF